MWDVSLHASFVGEISGGQFGSLQRFVPFELIHQIVRIISNMFESRVFRLCQGSSDSATTLAPTLVSLPLTCKKMRSLSRCS